MASTVKKSYKVGEAPWELEKSYKVGQAPWEQTDEIETSEEKADISAFDRMVVKNLSDSPEITVKYLQKKYPDQQFTIQDNRVFARATLDKASTGFNSPVEVSTCVKHTKSKRCCANASRRGSGSSPTGPTMR